MSAPRPIAQRREITPWSTEGGRGMCGICETLDKFGLDQSLRSCSLDRRVRDAGSDFHKLQGVLWKCGKLNFCKLRPFRLSDLLRKDLTSPRFPFAPSTERK